VTSSSLPAVPPEPEACHGPTCVTCADQADRVTIVEVDGVDAQVVDDGGRRSRVDISLVGPVGAGDEVLVHGGVAIAAPGVREGAR
jgi:hydrogenase expression/formation protein HypC